MDTIRFADAAREFCKSAEIPERDLLPLIPPDAQLGAESKVKPHQLGKIPGRFRQGKWYGLTGTWPTFGLSPADRRAAALWPTHNVGLRAADFPAVDCDVESPEALALVEEVIQRSLGNLNGPVRTRGQSPRALFVFKRDGDDPVRKTRIEFTCDKGVQHAVEVLGLGQQYVVSGMHPTGVAYEWRASRQLVNTTADKLPKATAASLTAFMQDLDAAIRDRGWTVTKVVQPKYGTGAQGQGFVLNELDPLCDHSVVLDALRAVPNTLDNIPSREQFVSLCASFKHALGRRADEFYAEFEAWANEAEPGIAPPEWVRPIWDSLTSVRTSPDYLFGLARRRGFHGDALADFAAYKDDEATNQRIATVSEQGSEEDQALRDVADRLLYWPEEGVFVVKSSAKMLSKDALNSYPGIGTLLAPAGAGGVKAASNILLNSGKVRLIDGVVYYPGQPQEVKWRVNGRDGDFYNTWHPQHHVLPKRVTDADVQVWLDHVAYLVPDRRERETLLDYFAHIVQHRGTKIRWAPLLIGRQGTGKDLMLKPLVMWFGHNATGIKPTDLFGKFNKYIENEFIVVEEMVRIDKAELYNAIKVMISGSATGRLVVEKKFRESYEVPNLVNFFFFSNNPDAVKIDDDDRRFFVMSSDVDPKDQDYYTQLGEEFYLHQSGWRKVIRWLQQRDVTGLDITRPIDTGAKRVMIDTQRSVLFVTLQEQLAGRDTYYGKRTILTANEIMMAAQTDFSFPLSPKARASITNTTEITKALRVAGWHCVDRVLKVAGKVIRVWVRTADMLSWAPAQLRERYELETAASDFEREESCAA